jgi:hypothetical protein
LQFDYKIRKSSWRLWTSAARWIHSRTADVHVHHLAKHIIRELLNGGNVLEAGVRNEDVDAAELGDRLVDHALHGGLVADVDADAERGGQRGGDRLRAGAVQVGNHDARACECMAR